MANIIIKHTEINSNLERIVEEFNKIDKNINNLNDTLGTIGQSWQCENGNYVQNISLNQLAKLKSQEENIKVLVNKIIQKLGNYNELEKRVLKDFGESD